jgi:hypothetical protein
MPKYLYISILIFLEMYHSLWKRKDDTFGCQFFEYLYPHYALDMFCSEDIVCVKIDTKSKRRFSIVRKPNKRLGCYQNTRG